MATIEEMKVEKSEIEEVRIENRVTMTRVYVGSGDDYITVSGNDISVFERFIAAGDELENLANEMERLDSQSEERDILKEIEYRKEFSEKAAECMDNVFGEGTTRKFFGDVYKEIPSFRPDIECFIDFWDSLIPVIEKMSEHKVKLVKLSNRRRMNKYQPRSGKGAAKNP